jgi:hypothetical protein
MAVLLILNRWRIDAVSNAKTTGILRTFFPSLTFPFPNPGSPRKMVRMSDRGYAISAVHDYLAERYEKELGQTLTEGVASDSAACWRLVDATTLRAAPGSKPAAGSLFDPELGLHLFVIPFVQGETIEEHIQAALELLATEPPKQRAVSLLWLVEAPARDAWQSQVAQLRNKSQFSECLGLDAIFYAPDQLDVALAAHGFPALLFVTRHVLAKSTPAELANWMSVDQAVVLEMEGFADWFADPEQRNRAQLILDHLSELALAAKTDSPATLTPKALNRLDVQNFRNLRQVRLDFGAEPVSCQLVQGPNGTGKSGLCEALSLALTGSSSRYAAFLAREEKDVTGTDRRRAYTEKYLTPIGQPDLQPRLGLNGKPLTPPPLVESADEAGRQENEFSGSLLSQEASRAFSQMSADQLALRVLTGYSGLAEKLEAFVEDRVDAAQQQRQTFLRSLGVSSMITKLQSALERIIDQVLAREWPAASPALLDWLANVAQHPAMDPGIASLLNEWREWNNPETRRKLAATLDTTSEETVVAALEELFQAGNELRGRTLKLLEQFDNRLAPFGEHLGDTLREMEAWGEWLRLKATPAGSQPTREAPGPNLETARKELADAQAAQEKIKQAGMAAKKHLEHLDHAIAFLGCGWAAQRSGQCPTCGSDHSSDPIDKVLTEHRSRIDGERAVLAREYKSLGEKINSLQEALRKQGETPCPVSEERQVKLRDALAWLSYPGQTQIETQLKDPPQRNRLLSLLQKLQTAPPLPNELNARQEAQRCAVTIMARIEDARGIFHDPDHWKPVQAAFVKKLAKVMADHLPRTLQRLWAELTLNLTAAAWLLPQRPTFDVVNRRGVRRVSVCVEERLARYILNQAETHTLGLSWFFTRYFTYGRFRGQFLIMDDPAPHLDATSFNALSRLWRALVRLHSARGIPFRLVVFLADKDRAIETARCTDGTVEVLGWRTEQSGELGKLELATS